jgi:hypothetical protein
MNTEAKATRRPIEIHIDELVLDGFAPADSDRIGDELERQMARLLTGAGELGPLAQRSRMIPAFDAGEFHLSSGATPQAIGSQVARAVCGGLFHAPARGKGERRGR